MNSINVEDMWRWAFFNIFCLFYANTTVAKQTCVINFELEADLIVVQASIDGEIGNFILDTGAPSLILNAQHFSGQTSELEAVGLHSAIQLQEKTIRTFEWSCLQKHQFNGLIIDLAHLEHRIQRPLLGLIGYEILKDWHILFDYTQRQIELYKGNSKTMHTRHQALTTTDFQLHNHLVTFTLDVDGEERQFIIDSASGANLLDKTIAQANFVALDDPIILRSADQEERIYKQVLAQKSQLKDAEFFNQVFIQVNLKDMVQGVDGLLGFPFLSCCKISIDYKRKRITIWEDSLKDKLAQR